MKSILFVSLSIIGNVSDMLARNILAPARLYRVALY